MVLKRMKRRHSRADAVALVERLKAARPDIAIGADLIAGFPTEDEAMFANTLALIDDCDIVHGHIFPYSARAPAPPPRGCRRSAHALIARARRAAARGGGAAARAMAAIAGRQRRSDVLVERAGRPGPCRQFRRSAAARPPQPGDDRSACRSRRRDRRAS